MIKYCFLIYILFSCTFQSVFAKKIYSKDYKFKISIPDQAIEITNAYDTSMDMAYYDTTIGLTLVISAQEGKFRSVKDYMDCTSNELEQQLKNNFGDQSLKLLSCNLSTYYPQKATVLHFEVPFSFSGNDNFLVYFIHHNHKDIQILFNYKKEKEQICMDSIDAIMKTLQLKGGI